MVNLYAAQVSIGKPKPIKEGNKRKRLTKKQQQQQQQEEEEEIEEEVEEAFKQLPTMEEPAIEPATEPIIKEQVKETSIEEKQSYETLLKQYQDMQKTVNELSLSNQRKKGIDIGTKKKSIKEQRKKVKTIDLEPKEKPKKLRLPRQTKPPLKLKEASPPQWASEIIGRLDKIENRSRYPSSKNETVYDPNRVETYKSQIFG